MKDDKERLIEIFTLILMLNMKIIYLKDFCNNNTKIQIRIDIFEIGVDIENIIYII